MSRPIRRRARQRGRGAAVFAAAALLLGVGAVLAITVALDSLGGGFLTRPMCYAEDPGGQVRLSPEQMGNAALIAGIGQDLQVGERAITIALATAMQESSLRNLDHGDRDSLGLFQQRPSQGWGSAEQVQDRVYATRLFYERLLEVPGYEEMPLTVAAQTVQISAFPDAYAKHERLATALRAVFEGTPPGSLTCTLAEDSGLHPTLLLGELALAHPDATAVAVGDRMLIDSPADPWVIAHWVVATAGHTGVRNVVVDGHAWTPEGGWVVHPGTSPGVLVG